MRYHKNTKNPNKIFSYFFPKKKIVLSQNSLWKLSIFHGYKGYLYWSEKGMRRVSFSITEWIGNLAL